MTTMEASKCAPDHSCRETQPNGSGSFEGKAKNSSLCHAGNCHGPLFAGAHEMGSGRRLEFSDLFLYHLGMIIWVCTLGLFKSISSSWWLGSFTFTHFHVYIYIHMIIHTFLCRWINSRPRYHFWSPNLSGYRHDYRMSEWWNAARNIGRTIWDWLHEGSPDLRISRVPWVMAHTKISCQRRGSCVCYGCAAW